MAKGTVLVRLRRDWFGPDGSLYEVKNNPHEFPAAYAEEPDKLSDKEKAELLRSGKTLPKDQKYAVLPSSAEIVEGGKEVAVLQQTASGYVEVATAVEGEVKSVGGALDDKGHEQPSQSTTAAASAAKEMGVDVGANPRESGPLPGGAKPVKK